MKNKSDVHNLLLSASKKTNCANAVLGEITTVYFQNYTKEQNSTSRVWVHPCSTQRPHAARIQIRHQHHFGNSLNNYPFMENQGIQNTPYPELNKSQLQISILSSHLCLMSLWIVISAHAFLMVPIHATCSYYLILDFITQIIFITV